MLRVALLLIAAFLLVVVAPYTWARLRAPVTAVSIAGAPSSAQASASPRRALRVGCWNIAHARGGVYGASNWDGGPATARADRLRRMGELLDDLDLDIIVLNEVDFDAVWSGGVDQAAAIAEVTGHRFIARQRNVDILLPFSTIRFGNAILSRSPIESARLITLPAITRRERLLGGAHDGMVARLRIDEATEIDVVAVHLSARSRSARLESVRTLEPLVTAGDVPVLLMGDFNSVVRGAPVGDPSAMERFAAFGTHRLVPDPSDPAPTFPSEEPNRTIDWIMSPVAWTVREAQVVRSDLSDHLPVIAELGLDEVRFGGSGTGPRAPEPPLGPS